MSQDNASFTFLHRIEEVELNIEDGVKCYNKVVTEVANKI
jgi:hypothetical protein